MLQDFFSFAFVSAPGFPAPSNVLLFTDYSVSYQVSGRTQSSVRFTTLLVLGSLNCPTSIFSQAQLRDMSDKTN